MSITLIDSFSLSLSIPKDWVVATAQKRAELDEQIKKIMNAPEQKKMAQIGGVDRAEQDTPAHYEAAAR